MSGMWSMGMEISKEIYFLTWGIHGSAASNGDVFIFLLSLHSFGAGIVSL